MMQSAPWLRCTCYLVLSVSRTKSRGEPTSLGDLKQGDLQVQMAEELSEDVIGSDDCVSLILTAFHGRALYISLKPSTLTYNLFSYSLPSPIFRL
ncbi:hypothetical protein IW261DRAFT_1526117 [Armillaria novae-zelandiae]|uniref:Uncharacterized protein n=1 Tax=Armillaria novae-zelandiae TaxID=153914 RepID=A0AA39ND41_9AGAR|nr:hypothetical protein IW261DRAFT_1526117 [Armillaria novae-zelandiae]